MSTNDKPNIIAKAIRALKNGGLVQRAYKALFILISKRPPKKNLVVFESYLGKQYSCNPRAIYEYMAANKPEYELVWSVDKNYTESFDRQNIPYVKRLSLGWLFTLAKAKYWVVNSRMPLWIPKPKHTIYVQTWHGTPLKKLANDMDEVHMPNTTTEGYKRNFTREASNWDYLISPNEYSSAIFRRAFQFNKELIESGYPRNDLLHAPNMEERAEQIKEKLQLPQDKKIVLYAPTWRDNEFYGKGKYKFKIKLDLDKMREELGDEYIILLRMHYLVSENFDLSAYEGFAYDFSLYGDISELYLISDILITDYSSVFFDYANLRRPIIFFTYDIDTYRDQLRGFYFNLEDSAPGPLLKTSDEVIQTIKELNPHEIHPNYDAFYERFCSWENGDAAKKVVETVFD